MVLIRGHLSPYAPGGCRSPGAALAVPGSWVVVFLGPGEAPGKLIQVAGAEQHAQGGVVARRQRPVGPGGVAAPDPPPRIPALEPVQPAVPLVDTVAGGHRRGPLVAV